MGDPKELAGRYAALWMEPDAEERRGRIEELWAEDGAHLLQPPQEMVDAAAALGFELVLEARGHDALEFRVTSAYEEFVAPGGFVFKARDDAARLGDVVKFTWEMAPAGGGEPAGVGLEILVLDGEGRIRTDHQFIVG